MNSWRLIATLYAFLLSLQALGIAADGTAITCKVTNALRHDPVLGAEVTLTDLHGHAVKGKTGFEGSATLVISDAGPFILTGDHTDFVPVRSDSYYPFDGAQIVRRVNDQTFTACELRLKPLGRIEGSVADKDHNPVANATVTALSRTYRSPGTPTFVLAKETHTAGDGSFALPLLLPGIYVLRVSPPSEREGKLRTTYYPLSADAQSASPIALSPGATFMADVEIQSASLSELVLTVTTQTGRLRDETVTVMRGVYDFNQLYFGPDCCGEIRLTDGRALLKGIPATTYVYQVISVVEGRELEGYSTVALGDRPTYSVDVELKPSLTVSAKVVRKNRSEGEPPQRLKVFLQPVNTMFGMVVSAETNVDDSLRFDEVRSGPYRWSVDGLNRDEYAEMWASGRPRRDGLIEISGGAQPFELRVMTGAAAVEVKAAGDREVCIDTKLVVIPRESGQPAAIARPHGFGCQFELGGLAPGSYDVALVSLLEQGQVAAPSFRSLLSGAEQVKLSSGERRQLTLPVQTVFHEY